MKKSTVLFVLVLLPLLVTAQHYKTIELKPITKQGWKYFYDLKKVSSPVALEVPLLSLQDVEVNRYLKSSQTWKVIGGVVTLVPLIYIISLPQNTYVNQSTFWYIVGGTILAQIGFDAISHAKLGKAIDRYNYVIMQPSGNSLGLQLTWKFL